MICFNTIEQSWCIKFKIIMIFILLNVFLICIGSNTMKKCSLFIYSILLTLGLSACGEKEAVQNDATINAAVASETADTVQNNNEFAQPLADYKQYVQDEVNRLVEKTDAFVAAIKAGELAQAKAMYADTRQHYERIEPIAELFSDLDRAIDVREDDFKDGVNDPEFTGFHRIEYVLWEKNTTDGLAQLADTLSNDVHDLQRRIDVLDFSANVVVGGAAELIEEVASGKISGEENRYSHTDLSDFQANVDGAAKIVSLFRSQIEAKNASLLKQLDEHFAQVNSILAKYQTDSGFQTYDQLTEEDRKKLQMPINALAEELSKLRGTLGLD